MRTLPQATQSLSECNFWEGGRLQNFVPVDINEAEYALRKVVFRSPVVSAMAVRMPGGGPDAGRVPFENYEPWSVAGPELGNEGVGVGKRLLGDCGAVVYVPETSRHRFWSRSPIPILGAIVAHVAPTCRRRHR